jgi:predicted PurR-regulated permease PerM
MKNSSKTIIGLISLILILILIYYFRTIVFYLAVSAILAMLGEPVLKAIGTFRLKNKRISRTFSALLTLILLLVIFFGLISALIPLIMSQAEVYKKIDPKIVLENLTEPITKSEFLFNRFHQFTEYHTLQFYIESRLEQFFDFGMLSQIFNSFASITGDLFLAIFSVSFITFFFLKDRNIPYNAVMLLTPKVYKEKISRSIIESKKLLTRYFVGVLIQILLIITLVTIGLSLIGVKNAFFIGFMVGIFNIVPYLGPLIGALLGILIALSTGLQYQSLSELWPLILKMSTVFGIVQLMDNFIFQPFIYSSSIKAHPLEIFLIILIAGKIAGIPGIILAIPIYTVVRVLFKQFLSNLDAFKKFNPQIEPEE